MAKLNPIDPALTRREGKMSKNSTNMIFALGGAMVLSILFMANPALANDIRNFGEFFSLFDPSLDGRVDDLSVRWLEQTFGNPFQDEEASTLTGFALGRLNAAVLAIGSLVLSYKIVVGIMQTAHDGSILGRRWSTLWGPTRVAIGAAAIVPLGSGLCLAQALVLTIASMGVGLANRAWEISVSGLLDYGKPLVAPRVSSKWDFAREVFDMSLCAQLANVLYPPKAEAAADSMLLSRTFPVVEGDVVGFYNTASAVMRSDDYEDNYLNANLVRSYVGGHPDLGNRYGQVCGAVTMPGGLSGSFGEFGTLIIDKPLLPLWDAEVDGVNRELVDLQRVRIQAIRTGTSITHGNALKGLIRNMASAAGKIAQNVNDDPAAGEAALVREPTADEIHNAIRNYNTNVIEAVADTFTQLRNNAKEELRLSALSGGWANVGAWYQVIAGYNASITQLAEGKPDIMPPNWALLKRMLGYTAANSPVEEAIKDADDLWRKVAIETKTADQVREQNAAFADFQPIVDRTPPDPGSDAGDAIGWLARSIGGILKSGLTAVGDFLDPVLPDINVPDSDVNTYADAANPLGIIQRMGKDMESLAIWLILGGAVANVVGQFASLAGGALGVLGKAGDWGGSAAVTVGFYLLIPALIMGYLIPMMPWVLWISALIGWFILVAEAVVAAPLWALSHMRMDGEGLAGPLGEKGYFLLLSMLLRPVLMVIGFIMGMILFNIFAGVTATGFDLAVAANNGQDGAGLAGSIFLFFILAGMYVWMAYKSFSLIHIVPDRILRWIGMGGEGLGEEEGMRETKLIAMAGLHQLSGGAGSIVKGVGNLRVGAKGDKGMDPKKGLAKDGGGGGGGGGNTATRSASNMIGQRRSTRQG